MLTSKRSPERAPGFSRVPTGRFALQVAAGAMVVVALIALMVSCAANAPEPERLGSASSALLVTGLFATGVDATGKPLAVGATDPHYVLTSDDPARPGPAALAVTAVGGWIANTLTSNWVSAQANAIGANLDDYTFTTTFTLAGVDPTTVTINGTWACDDSCVLELNGTTVASYGAPAWNAVGAFTIPAGSPFVIGANTLAFVATNSGGAATGLQVISISGTASGCTTDNQCTNAQFCNTQTGTCLGTLPSGTPIPTITGHTPVLDGICASGVGEAVCDAGVCDMSDNECGLANGNGPCTVTNGATLCQSGACSENGTCEPNGGCNVDGDCAGGQNCDVTTHTCTGSLDAGADGSDGGGGGADASDSGSFGSETGDEGGSVGGESVGEGGSVGADGSEGDDGSASTDGRPGDARDEDAAPLSGEDASEPGGEGGSNAHKELLGGGLSCSASRSGSGEPSGAPLWILGLAVAAASGRRRRDRARGDRCE